MKLSPINNYSSYYNQNRASFKGTVDKDIYKILEESKQEIKTQYKNKEIDKLTAYNLTERKNKTIEGFNKIAERLHPDTKFLVKKVNEPHYTHLFTDEYLLFYAKNDKLKKSLDIKSEHYNRYDNRNPEEHKGQGKTMAVALTEEHIRRNSSPEKIDKQLFETNIKAFLDEVQEKFDKGLIVMDEIIPEEKGFAKYWKGLKNIVINNKITNQVTKSELIKQAMEYDEMAPEFHSQPNILDKLNEILELENIEKDEAIPDDLTKLDVTFEKIYEELKLTPDQFTLNNLLENNEINVNHVNSDGDSLLMHALAYCKQFGEYNSFEHAWGYCTEGEKLKEQMRQSLVVNTILNHPKIDVKYTNKKGENALTRLLDNSKYIYKYQKQLARLVSELGVNYYNPVTKETLFDTLTRYEDKCWTLSYGSPDTDYIIRDENFDINKNAPIFHILERLNNDDVIFKWMQNPEFDRSVKNENGLSIDDIINRLLPWHDSVLAYKLVLLKEKNHSDVVFKDLKDKDTIMDFLTTVRIHDNKKDIEFLRTCFDHLFTLEELRNYIPKIEQANNKTIEDVAKSVLSRKRV